MALAACAVDPDSLDSRKGPWGRTSIRRRSARTWQASGSRRAVMDRATRTWLPLRRQPTRGTCGGSAAVTSERPGDPLAQTCRRSPDARPAPRPRRARRPRNRTRRSAPGGRARRGACRIPGFGVREARRVRLPRRSCLHSPEGRARSRCRSTPEGRPRLARDRFGRTFRPATISAGSCIRARWGAPKPQWTPRVRWQARGAPLTRPRCARRSCREFRFDPKDR
jgi:hypothetical protein